MLVTNSVSTPSGEEVRSFFSADSVLLAITYDAVYRSPDLGEQWLRLDLEPPGHLISAGGRVFVTNEDGSIRSDDGGRTWKRISGFHAISPMGRLVAWFDGSELVLSSDYGENWRKVDRPDDTSDRIEVLNDSVLYIPISEGEPHVPGIDSSFVSLDRGRTWRKAPRPPGSVNAEGGLLWIKRTSPADRSLLISRDFGFSWHTVKNLPPHSHVRSVWPNGVVELQDSSGAIVLGDTLLSNWQPVRIPGATRVDSIGRHAGRWFANTDLGLVRSDDEGKSWKPAGTGIPLTPSRVAIVGRMRYMQERNQRIFRHDTVGEGWKEEALLGPSDSAAVRVLDRTGPVVVTPNAVRLKRNGAWEELPAPPFFFDQPGPLSFRLGKVGDVHLIADNDTGETVTIARLEPGSARWKPTDFVDTKSLTDFVSRDSVVYVGSGQGVYHSRDLGVTWPLVASGITEQQVEALSLAGDWLVAATASGVEVVDLARDDPVWERRTSSFLTGYPSAIWSDPRAPNVIIVGTTSGVFWSNDRGTTFHAARDGTGREFSAPVTDLVHSGDTLLVAAATGLYVAVDRIPRHPGIFGAVSGGIEWVRSQAGEPWFWFVGPVASALTAYLVGLLALLLLAWRKGSLVLSGTWLAEKATMPLLAVPGLARRLLFIGYGKRLQREDPAVRAAAAHYFGLPAEAADGEVLLPSPEGDALHSSIAAALDTRQPALLVGIGGAGKTTLLGRLAYLALVDKPPAGLEGLRPVLVPAAYYHQDLPTTVAAALRERLGVQVNAKTLTAQLEAGGLLVLFDGVSEVESEDQGRVLERLLREARSDAYRNCRFVFATRPLLDLPADVPTVRLLPLTPETVSVLLDRYKLPPHRQDQVRRQLRGFGGRPIGPLLFSMVVVDSAADTVSRTRSELYERYFRRLLKLSDKGPEWAGWRRVLSRVAQWSLLDAGVRGVGLRHADLLSRLDTPETINGTQLSLPVQLRQFYGVRVPKEGEARWVHTHLVKAGVMDGDAARRWRFAHDTYEEFFAAARLAELVDETGCLPALPTWQGDREREHAFGEVLIFARELIEPAHMPAVLGGQLPATWRAALAGD